MKFIDSHCHPDNIKYLTDEKDTIEESTLRFIKEAFNSNIENILSIITNPANLDILLNISKEFNGLNLATGLHPCDIDTYDNN